MNKGELVPSDRLNNPRGHQSFSHVILHSAEIARKLGIAEQTFYRWKKEYGGLEPGFSSVTQRLP